MNPVTHKLLIVILSISVLTFVGCGRELTETEYVQSAKTLLDRNNLKGAVLDLKNALRINANNSEARYLLGKVYYELRQAGAAEKEIVKARELGVPPGDLVLMLADTLLMQSKYSEVLNEIQPRESYSAQLNADLHATRAEAYLGLNDLENALPEIKVAQSLSPDSPRVNTVLAKQYIYQRKYDQARVALARASEVSASYAPAWSSLGDMESMERNHPAALEGYTAALALNPHRFLDRLKKAENLIAMQRYDEAGEELATVRKQVKSNYYTEYLEGVIKFYTNDHAAAQNRLEHSLRLRSNFNTTYFYLGAAHYAQQQFEQAEHFLEKYHSANRTFIPVKKLLVAVYLRNGKLDSAESLLDEVLTVDPADKAVMNLKSELAHARGADSEALGYLEKVAELDPKSSLALRNLALGYVQAGNFQLALESLDQASEVDPDLVDSSGGKQLRYISFMSGKDYSNALKVAREMQAASANSADPHTLIGGALTGLGRLEEAIESYNRALAITPGDMNATRNLAKLLARLGKQQEVKALYRKAVAQEPANVEAVTVLARLESDSGNVERAQTILEQALDNNEQSLLLRLHLARNYIDQQSPRKAVSLLRSVANDYPEDAGFLREYGISLLLSGDPRGAATNLESLASSSQAAGDYYLLARAYKELNNFNSMRDAVSKALEVDPRHLPSRLYDAQFYLATGEIEEARSRVHKLRAEHPQDREVLELVARLAIQKNRLDEAAEILAGMEIEPPKSYLLAEMAAGYWANGRAQDSIKVLTGWLDSNPNDRLILKKLADYRLALGQNELAISDYLKVIELAPDDISSLNNLAWLMKGDDLNKALELARRAYQLSPRVPSVNDTLGTILMELGDDQEALQFLSKAYDGAAANPNIAYHYSLALVKNGRNNDAIEILDELVGKGGSFSEQQPARDLLESLKK